MKRRFGDGMVGWIFKRTLLALASALGGWLLILLGLASCVGGGANSSSWYGVVLMVLGGVLILAGILLNTFAKNLSRWWEIK